MGFISVENMKFLYQILILVIMFGLVLMGFFYAVYKIYKELTTKKKEYATKDDLYILDEAFNDMDRDYSDIQVRMDQLETYIKLRMNEEGTICLPDLIPVKKKPGRPKRIDQESK